jgi:hypothetical protein
MNMKPPECWASDANARAVRIETSPEHTVLLPFDHFMFAEMRSVDGEQLLRAVFVTHELVVRGTALRRIETALPRTELSHLACGSARYEKLIPDGQPVGRELVVTQVKDRDAAGTS